MQFKKVCLATQNGQANLKFAFIKAFTVSLFLLQLLFACNPAFYFIMGKTYEDIYHSPPQVSVIMGNILITITTFAQYHFLFAFNIIFMTDPLYFSFKKTLWLFMEGLQIPQG